MTHLSKFRYGEKMHEPPSVSRGCSEVRVSYFDPVTGKPCKEKPKPISNRRKDKASSYERNAKRTEDIEEAAEIMRNMNARKKANSKDKKDSGHGRKRAVLVDGERFESLTAAAEVLGVSANYMSKQLRAGAKYVHGRKVEIAEVSR